MPKYVIGIIQISSESDEKNANEENSDEEN